MVTKNKFLAATATPVAPSMTQADFIGGPDSRKLGKTDAKKMTVLLEDQLWLALKTRCLTDKTTAQKVQVAALEAYLRGPGAGSGGAV